MRRPVIGLLCGVMLLVMLACGAYALSGGDSLISLSYLTGTFVPKAVSTGNEAAEKASGLSGATGRRRERRIQRHAPGQRLVGWR